MGVDSPFELIQQVYDRSPAAGEATRDEFA